jgi:hypothetical protein
LLVLVRYQDAAALRDVTVGHIRDTEESGYALKHLCRAIPVAAPHGHGAADDRCGVSR